MSRMQLSMAWEIENRSSAAINGSVPETSMQPDEPSEPDACLDVRPGAVAVYALDGDRYATGDLAHGREIDIWHNIAVLARQLRGSRRGSVRLVKDYDATLHRDAPVDWVSVWRDLRLYGQPLFRITPDGDTLGEAAWQLHPDLGLRPCAPDSPFRLTDPEPKRCAACDRTIPGRLELEITQFRATRCLMVEWRCPAWGVGEGHLWRQDRWDRSLAPRKKRTRSKQGQQAEALRDRDDDRGPS